MNDYNPSTDCASCLGCSSAIYGNDFVEPRKGYVICGTCVRNGCKLEPSSIRLIDETRGRVSAMGLSHGQEFLVTWRLVMAEVRDELESFGIPVYADRQVMVTGKVAA